MNLTPVMSGSWNLTVSSVAMGFAIDVQQPLLIYVLPQFAENFNIAQTNINSKRTSIGRSFCCSDLRLHSVRDASTFNTLFPTPLNLTMSTPVDAISRSFIADVHSILELVKASRVMYDQPEAVHIGLAECTAREVVSHFIFSIFCLHGCPLVAIDPVHPKAEASPTLAPVSFPLLDPPRSASPIDSLLVDVVGVAGVPVEALQPLDELAGLTLIELHHTPRTPRASSSIDSLLGDVLGVAGVPVDALQPLDELAGLDLIELHHTPRTLPLQDIDPGEEPRPILASLPAPPADSPTDTGSALASLGQYDDHDIEMDQTVAQALTPVTAQLQSHFDDMVV